MWNFEMSWIEKNSKMILAGNLKLLCFEILTALLFHFKTKVADAGERQTISRVESESCKDSKFISKFKLM